MSEFFERKPSGEEGQQLRILLDGLVDFAAFLLDDKGLVRTWSVGAEKITGYASDEVRDFHYSAFSAAEEPPPPATLDALAVATHDGRYESEAWWARKDGTRFRASIVLDAIRNGRGELAGFAALVRDVTRQLTAREALRQSEERFRILVDGVTDYAIFMLDPDGFITNWNRGGQRIKGYMASEIVGKHFSVFYTPDDRDAGVPQNALMTAAIEGRYEAEGWRLRKDGTRFFASVVIDRIRNDKGELAGFAKVTRDVTQRVKTQQMLDEARGAFVQSQKMEAVGQLTSGVAHDFNNLLTIIATNADLLSQPALNERDRKKLIDSIQRAADRGAKLTQQLLAFARRQPLQPQTQSVRELLGNFEAMLRRGAGDAIAIEFDLADEPDLASIDAPQFEAAILNLIVNARDAMPGGGLVRLRTRVVDIATRTPSLPGLQPGRHVMIAVQDDGTGMPPDTLSHAFEPFFTTKDAGKGSGLGLSQVYGFVTQSGGEVRIDSAVGTGTTITLYLPCVAGTGESDTAEPARRTAVATVLVVDDDPDVLDAAIAMLNSLGYEVLTAADATSALTTLRRSQPIDILFTDIVMPKGMNGVELARAAMRLRPGIKVLLASGYPMSALPVKADLQQEFAFLSKPYRWSELSERLRSIVH